MIIRREKTKNYTVICNELLQRKDISARAKGIYAYIMTLPDDWQLYMSELFSHFAEGTGALKTAFKELENAGYIYKNKRKSENGQFNGWEYTVTEYAKTDRTENRLSENRPVGNSILLSTNGLSTNITNHLLNTENIVNKENITENQNTNNTNPINHHEDNKGTEASNEIKSVLLPIGESTVPPTKTLRPIPYKRYKLTTHEIGVFELYRKLLLDCTKNWANAKTGYAHESIGHDVRALFGAVKDIETWEDVKKLITVIIRGEVDDILVRTREYPKMSDIVKIIKKYKFCLDKT